MNAVFFRRFLAAHPLAAIVIGAAVGCLLGSLVSAVAPKAARVSLAFTVAEQARQETPDYSYDGYYSIRAAELVADSLMSWLSTPSVIKDIYVSAGIPIDDTQAFAKAGRAFRAKKLSSQNVVVTFNAPDRSSAAKLARQMSRTLSSRAAQLVLTSKNQPLFLVSASSPVIADASLPPAGTAAAGLCLGAFLGFAAAYHARRKPSTAPDELKSPQP
jgi:hypothetical protein